MTDHDDLERRLRAMEAQIANIAAKQLLMAADLDRLREALAASCEALAVVQPPGVEN